MMINLPQDTLQKIKNKIPFQAKVAFISSMIFGVITHIYIFTNLLFNHDGILSQCGEGATLTSGRWALGFAAHLSGDYQTPAVIAFFSIVFISLSCVCVVSVLNIKSSVSICLVSGIMVTFPTVVCTFSYLFTADAYFLSLFLSVFSVYIATKYKYGFIPAAIILGVSVGIYQAYLCCAAALFVLKSLLNLFDEDLTWKEFWIRTARYLATLVLCLIAYYGILQFLLFTNNEVLTNYRGISQMGKISFSDIPNLIKLTFTQIFNYFTSSNNYSFINTTMLWIQRFVLFATPILTIILMIAKYGKKCIAKLILSICALIALLFAANCMQVLNPQEAPHVLMLYAFSFVFIIFIKLIEMSANIIRMPKTICVVSWVATIICCTMIFQNYLLTNAAYLRLQSTVNASYHFANRMVQRIEQQEGYSVKTPIFIDGEFPYVNYDRSRDYFEFANELTGIYADYSYYTAYQLQVFIEDYLGFAVLEASKEQIDAIKKTTAYKELPIYPAQGSVTTIDDIIVVKMADPKW